MKKVLTKFLALSGIALLMLSACKKDGALVTANAGQPGALTASTTSLVLDKALLDSSASVINFSFTPPSYGYNAAITNTLQIDAAGDNWVKPTSVTLGTKAYTQGYSTNDFNNMILKLNLPAGVASTVNVRVVHSISSTVAPIYSNVLSLTVTPFNLTSWIYVPGAYEGWSNPGAQEDSLTSITGNGVYTGIINFTDGNNQFLIVPVKGSWATKYATTNNAATGSTASYSTELVSTGGNNFYAPSAAGQYLVTLNTNTSTLTIVPADFYSVIGDAAQGWSTDVEMKYINDANQSWALTLPLVSSGAFKIRQDDAWANSWGIPKSGSAGFGTAATLNNSSNDNISVAANGTYTVTFVMPATALATSSYNSLTFPFATTTYSVQ